MQIQTYEQRILIPEDGKWLYNESENVISDKVYLGKEADASAWVEITEEEKRKIEEILKTIEETDIPIPEITDEEAKKLQAESEAEVM